MCDAPYGIPLNFVKDLGLDTIGLSAYGHDPETRDAFIQSEFATLTSPRLYIASELQNSEHVLGYLAVEFFRQTEEQCDVHFWNDLTPQFPIFEHVLQTHGSLLLCTVAGIAIAPQAQGKGIAKQLMNAFLQQVHGEIDMLIGISKNPAQFDVRQKTCAPYEMTHYIGAMDGNGRSAPEFVHTVARLLVKKERAQIFDPTRLILAVDPQYLRPFDTSILQDGTNRQYRSIFPLIEGERHHPGISLAYPLIGVGNHLLTR